MRAFFSSTDPEKVTCSSSTLSRFTKQLSVLLNAGIPMHEGLQTLMQVQADSLSLWVTPELRKNVTLGYRFSSVLRKFPRIFSPTYVALIRAAEETGKLVKSLDRLGDWLERRESIERQVRKALIYPLFVVVVAAILTLGLFRTVIPGILDTVVGLGVDLPWPTQLLLTLVHLIEQPLTWLLAFAVLAAIAIYLRSQEGWERFLILMSHVPVVGQIIMYSALSRYAHTMSMLLDSGVDIIRACRISGDASFNPLIRADAGRVAAQLREGRYYTESLQESPLYPSLLVDMVRVGDETGKLAGLLGRCGDIMEQDTLHKVDLFLNLLEPIVLSTISVGVGFIIIAVLMPMSSLISAL